PCQAAASLAARAPSFRIASAATCAGTSGKAAATARSTRRNPRPSNGAIAHLAGAAPRRVDPSRTPQFNATLVLAEAGIEDGPAMGRSCVRSRRAAGCGRRARGAARVRVARQCPRAAYVVELLWILRAGRTIRDRDLPAAAQRHVDGGARSSP